MPSTIKTPLATVDIIIEIQHSIVLIKRRNPPHGWALPGGFVDYGESVEDAARREAKEETSLDVQLVEQFHAYSDPERDARHHTISVVFIAQADGTPKAEDDAADLGLFSRSSLPEPVVFDHAVILNDYYRYKNGEALDAIFSSRMRRP